MPSLSVRAAAELLHLPAYQQLRILTEQKYPTQQPQVFRTPFYQPALSAIRDYYRRSNDPMTIGQARAKIRELRLPSRRDGNLRVLDAFEAGSQRSRRILPLSVPRLTTTIGNVQLRLGLDILADEAGTTRRIYYNCRTAELDPEIAKTTLEIAHWLLEQNDLLVPTRSIEFVDFTRDRVHRISNRRPGTVKRLRMNARVIEALWATI